jgi:hypothetical protein
MELEEKIARYKDLGQQIAELEMQKKTLVAEILQSIPKESKSIQVAGSNVKRVRRLSIRTSIEAAKLFEAVKMQEVVDKAKIKRLYEQGQAIPDVTEIDYIQVSPLKEECHFLL